MYLTKDSQEILRQSLKKLSDRTSITATSPGAIARSIAEIVSEDLGSFFSILEFNMQQSLMSTASGRALDLWGKLYNLPRKTLSDLATTGAIIGSFYFYLETPYSSDITIPRGIQVATILNNTLGEQFIYGTVDSTIIKAGRLRGFVNIAPLFADSIFTAGVNTLVQHSYTSGPSGVVIRCTNPKAIPAQSGYESDEDYRARLMKELRRSLGGTEISMRFTALSVPGVRDVVIRSAPFGLATIEAIVNSEDYNFNVGMVGIVSKALDLVKPVGVRVFVRQPNLMRVDIGASLTIKRTSTANSPEQTSTSEYEYRIKNTVLRYLNTLAVGEDLIYNQLISEMLSSTDNIVDITLTNFGINGTQILRKNYSPKDDELIIPGEITAKIN